MKLEKSKFEFKIDGHIYTNRTFCRSIKKHPEAVSQILKSSLDFDYDKAGVLMPDLLDNLKLAESNFSGLVKNHGVNIPCQIVDTETVFDICHKVGINYVNYLAFAMRFGNDPQTMVELLFIVDVDNSDFFVFPY